MSQNILVLQQVAHEGPGRIYTSLRRAGATEDVIPCYRKEAAIPDSLTGYGGLIIMGGPMSANNTDTDPLLARQSDLIAQAIAADFPTLGICLGAQLIAQAAGARIFQGPVPEIGWYQVHLSLESADDPLFADLPNPLPVFQWHGEGFDLPGRAVHLASSPAFPHQAFRIGRHVYGLQFHLETEEAMVKEWVTVNRDELTQLAEQVDVTAITDDISERCGALVPLADTVISRWLALAAAGTP